MKRFSVEKIRDVSSCGITHLVVCVEDDGMFISPDKRYPQRTEIFAGSEDECKTELDRVSAAEQARKEKVQGE